MRTFIGRLVSPAALLTAVALVAIGCGGASATATPTPTAAATAAGATATASHAAIVAEATPTPAPGSTTAAVAPTATAAPATVAPTTAPTTTPVPTFALPSFTSDKELEAALPSTYKGATLYKISITGVDATNPSNASGKAFLDLIQSLGKTAADLSVAFAGDSAGKLHVTWGAYRIKGLAADVWVPLYYEIAKQEDPGTTATDVNLGGRAVKRVVTPDEARISYAWTRGDIVFIVIATSDELAGPAIAAVP